MKQVKFVESDIEIDGGEHNETYEQNPSIREIRAEMLKTRKGGNIETLMKRGSLRILMNQLIIYPVGSFISRQNNEFVVNINNKENLSLLYIYKIK